MRMHARVGTVANNLSDQYGFIEQAADGEPDLFFDRRQSVGIISAGTAVGYVSALVLAGVLAGATAQ